MNCVNMIKIQSKIELETKTKFKQYLLKYVNKLA